MQEAWSFKKTRKCAHCRKIFRPKSEEQVFCRIVCGRAAWFKKSAAEAAKRLNPVPDKHRGGWAELIACAWLLEQGYEVFRNISSVGPIDLVAVRDNETLLIDVKHINIAVTKKGNFYANGPLLKPNQREAGVIPLYVSPDGVCSFSPSSLAEAYSDTLNKAFDDSAQIC